MPQLHALHFAAVGLMAVLAAVCPQRLWRLLLPGVSTAYLAHWDRSAALLLLGASAGVWLLGRSRRMGLWFGLGLLASLFLAARIWQRQSALAQVGIPVGFGFAALRLWHYQVERDRGALPAHGWLDLYSWLVYFPTVLVGPVQRFEDWCRWERRRRLDPQGIRAGLHRSLLGYCKVCFVAGVLLGQVLPRLLVPLPASLAVAIQTLFVLYAMFSGLSDIAIGAGRLLGQRVPENFEWPFLRQDLGAFWRHWHMSVSGWCRDYVFLPLLARWRRPGPAAAAAIAVFALWHELSAAYLAWGAWHAFGLVCWRQVERRTPGALHPVIGRVMLFAWMIGGTWGLHQWPRGGPWFLG